ncbi:putative serine-alanine-and proline-rich protein [Trypanosoma cruzi]|nr:putative serine-alanine-and proline-rich protein [Trypanosoma cruzi]
MMCRVFCVVLVLALLCCCSCVFAAKEEEEQQPQVTQVNAVCAGDGNVARWQLPGKSLWYNCTDAASGAGKMICDMGVGNCAPEDVKKRIKDGAEHGVFTINVTSPTPEILERWWKRNVEPKAVTVAIVPAKPPAARTPGPQEEEISRDTSPTPDSVSPTAVVEVVAGVPSPAEVPSDSGEIGLATRPEAGPPAARQEEASRDASKKNSESLPAVVENSTDVPPPPPPATPGSAGANSAAVAAATTDSSSSAASQASDPAPSGDPQGAAHSASAASPAPESIPDPEPTEGDGHSSHEPPVELQEETAAAPPNQLSQTGEEGGAAEGTEEDTAANATDTAASEGNSTAASMPAPLSSAPTKNALEKSVGTDACFHGTRLRALPPLVLAALTYGTLG